MPETPSPEATPAQEPTPQAIRSLNHRWINRNLAIRLFLYLLGSHLFAAFLFLLFALGARHSH